MRHNPPQISTLDPEQYLLHSAEGAGTSLLVELPQKHSSPFCKPKNL